MVPTAESKMGTAYETAVLAGRIGALGKFRGAAALRTNLFRPIATGGGLGHGQEFKERATPLPVHFHYHVPKCAGQTIDRHLAAVLSVNAYYRTRKRRGFGRFVFTRHDFGKMPDPNQTRVVGGHFLGISVEPLFAGRDLKRL